MKISELAERVSLSIDTIRFYEKQGLLDEEHYERGSNGYRQYSEAAVRRLQLVRLGKAVGFTLNEMRDNIRAWETDELTPQEKVVHLKQKLVDINRRIEELNQMKEYVQQKIDWMESPDMAHPPEPVLV
jgi:MerR family copper efflux transcriptional regulator